MTSDSIGVDISKDHLDVHRLSSGAAARFPNSSAGFSALAAWLSSEGVERVVYEPTAAGDFTILSTTGESRDICAELN